MMHGAVENVLKSVGDTPIVKLHTVCKHVDADIYVKLEYLNPGGSTKDRVAINIIDDAETRGLLKPGGTIVEATSGNTGVGLAMVAAVRGYKCTFVMPDKMSSEKIAGLRAFGAKVVVCPTAVEPDDPRSYYQTAKRLVEETPNSFYANQYHNPANPEAHYLSTGPEIWKQTHGEMEVFVAGMGTGGTLSGCGKFFKEQNPAVKLIGVDPIGSLYYDYVRTGRLSKPFSYYVEGIGEDFLPTTMNLDIIDEVVRVDDKQCFQMTRRLTEEEGLFAGGSAGAAVAGAIAYAEKTGRRENILVLLPDGASKYLSKIFNEDWMSEKGFLDQPHSLGTVAHLMAHQGNRSVISAQKGESIGRVIALLKEHGISHIPVLDGNRMIGLVSEINLLNKLLGQKIDLDAPIDDLIQSEYATVTPQTKVMLLNTIFNDANVVIVEGDDGILGLISKIDLIDYLAKTGNTGAKS